MSNIGFMNEAKLAMVKAGMLVVLRDGQRDFDMVEKEMGVEIRWVGYGAGKGSVWSVYDLKDRSYGRVEIKGAGEGEGVKAV